MAMNSRLCKYCDELLNHDFDAEGDFQYLFRFWPKGLNGITFPTLDMDSCPLCSIITESRTIIRSSDGELLPVITTLLGVQGVLFRAQLKSADNTPEGVYNLIFHTELGEVENDVPNDRLKHLHESKVCEVTLVPSSDPRVNYLARMKIVGTSTENDTGLEIMKSWLGNCRKSHDLCQILGRNHSDEDWTPKRLLKLMSNSTSEADMIQLCEDAPQAASYATLSYCWGGEVSLKLVRGNMEHLRNGIPVSSLPRTFRDAANTAKRLGLSYIWIDALCIVQDSADDWHVQSATMAKVYRNGLVNLSATSSSNSDGGLYQPRNANPLGMIPCHLELNSKMFLHGSYYAVSPKLVVGCDAPRHTDDQLSKRGWIFQEHMLAPRIIHFSNTQIFWQCQTMEGSESCPSGETMSKDNRALSLLDLHSPFRHHDPGKFWGDIVSEYQVRALSYETDRLVAISAIASESAHRFPEGATYVAGLWSSHLVQMLLWKSLPGRTKRTIAYVAPTWSWASVIGVIGTNLWSRELEPQTSAHITSVETRISLANDDSRFGAIVSGHLRLTGFLQQVSIAPDPDPAFAISMYGHTSSFTHFMTLTGGVDHNLSNSFPYLDDAAEAKVRFSAYCLPVSQSKTECHGLLLEKLDDELNTYRRVGMFETSGTLVLSHDESPVDGWELLTITIV